MSILIVIMPSLYVSAVEWDSIFTPAKICALLFVSHASLCRMDNDASFKEVHTMCEILQNLGFFGIGVTSFPYRDFSTKYPFSVLFMLIPWNINGW